MECVQTVGIDLPLKAPAWEDASVQVWLGYNDPPFIAKRHDVASCPSVAGLQQALADWRRQPSRGDTGSVSLQEIHSEFGIKVHE